MSEVAPAASHSASAAFSSFAVPRVNSLTRTSATFACGSSRYSHLFGSSSVRRTPFTDGFWMSRRTSVTSNGLSPPARSRVSVTPAPSFPRSRARTAPSSSPSVPAPSIFTIRSPGRTPASNAGESGRGEPTRTRPLAGSVSRMAPMPPNVPWFSRSNCFSRSSLKYSE